MHVFFSPLAIFHFCFRKGFLCLVFQACFCLVQGAWLFPSRLVSSTVSCAGSQPVSDPYTCCLLCLGQGHIRDRCSICRSFKKRTQKSRNVRLRDYLMECIMLPSLDLGCPDPALLSWPQVVLLWLFLTSLLCGLRDSATGEEVFSFSENTL